MRSVIVSFILLISSAAQTFDNTECLSNTSAELKIYRDENETVRCVHYGKGTVVEYTYAQEDKKMGEHDFVKGALISKKFHRTSDAFINLVPFNYGTPGFDEILLREFLREVKTIKTLPTLIQEFYPDEEQRKELVRQMLKEQKIESEPSENWLEDLIKIQTVVENAHTFEKSNPQIQKLTEDEEGSIVRTLTTNFNDHVTVQQCNADIFDTIANLTVLEMIKTKSFKDEPTTMGVTRVEERKPQIYLNRELFPKAYLTIPDSISKFTSNDTEEQIQKDKLLYFRNLKFKPSENYLHLSLLARILVHEIGHAKSLVILSGDMEYKLNDIFINLSVGMADKTKFPMISEAMKQAVQEQILDPFTRTIEYSAEIYFIDNLPCVL